MSLKAMYDAIPILFESAELLSLNEHVSLCYESIDDDLKSKSVYLNESATLTQRYLTETLDNIKNMLLGISDKVLQALSTYILNSVTALKRIQQRLLNIPKAVMSTISYKTYEYKKLDTLPTQVKEVISPTKVANDFNSLIDPKGFDKVKYSGEVDKAIDDFASEILGCRVRTRNNLPGAIREVAYREMRGKEKIHTLTVDRLDTLIKEILDYKELKASVQDTRREVLDYYESLKDSMKDIYKVKEEGNSLRSMYSPELGELDSFTAGNLSFGRIETDRLFNSYIRVYNEVFKTKLNILQDRVESNRKIINELLKVSYSAVPPSDPKLVY